MRYANGVQQEKTLAFELMKIKQTKKLNFFRFFVFWFAQHRN